MLDLYTKIQYNNIDITNITQFYSLDTLSNAKYKSIFLQHYIEQWKSAEEIAYDFYGSCDDVWAIFLANNVVNPFEDWLKTDTEILRLTRSKYDDENNIKYYELNGIKYDYPITNAVPVTNLQYEHLENDKKRDILVIIPELLTNIKSDAKLYFLKAQ